MAPTRAPSARLLHSLRSLAIEEPFQKTILRAISTTSSNHQDAEAQRSTRNLNPEETTYIPRFERKLMRTGARLVGSRRRRTALAKSPGIAFDQLPYQCFQEARKILIADREQKVKKIETERARIARLKAVDSSTFPGGDIYKQRRLRSMEAELERLKIVADVNDPNVKRKFEDGKGRCINS